MELLSKLRNNVLLLTLVVLGVYYPLLFAPLNSVDDPGMYHYLLNSDHKTIREIFFPGGSGTYYRPLLEASFFIDKYVWGLQESFMHLQSMVLHWCNTLLVFAVARRAGSLLNVASPVPPFLAALFFAAHPINTEAVAWISARTDLLAGFFILLSIWLLLRRRTIPLTTVIAAGCLFIACLAKETAIFFIPAAALAPFFLLRRGENGVPLAEAVKRSVVGLGSFGIAGIGYLYLRSLAFSAGDNGVSRVVQSVVGSDQAGEFLVTVRMVLKAAGFYLKKLFVPFPLNFGINSVSDWYVLLGIALLPLTVMLLMRRTVVGYFFVCALSVGASALLIPLLTVTWTPLAERYMYIPSGFFLIGICFSGQRAFSRIEGKAIITAVVGLLAMLALYGSASRTLLWQDNVALFRDTVQKSPGFLPAWNQYALALYEGGQQDEAAAVINSLKIPETLLNYQYGIVSKAAARIHVGDYAGARKILRAVLENPGKHEVMIVERLLKLNDHETREMKLSPGTFYGDNSELLERLYTLTGDPYVQYRLGRLHLFNGNRPRALAAFKRVVAQTGEKVYYHQPARKLVETLSGNTP